MSSRKIVRNADKPQFISDILDLKVDVSRVKPTESFRYITRAIFFINWAAAQTVFTQFGVDAALTKGLQIRYGDKDILATGLKSINDFSALSYDTRVDADGSGTPNRHMVTRLSFFKVTRNQLGLFVGKDRDFAINVQDDLSSSSNSAISVMLQGWRI